MIERIFYKGGSRGVEKYDMFNEEKKMKNQISRSRRHLKEVFGRVNHPSYKQERLNSDKQGTKSRECFQPRRGGVRAEGRRGSVNVRGPLTKRGPGPNW